MNKIHLIIALFFLSTVSYAQTTYFYGKNKANGQNYTGALYKVEIDRDMEATLVQIEVIPTKNLKRLNIWTSNNTIIKSGSFEAKYVGALSSDGKSTYSIDCSARRGWNNVKKGEKYYYTLAFAGVVPPGFKDFSLIDKGSSSGCRGFGFSNYTLNNPDNHPKTTWTEYSLKSHWENKGADPVEGIYENTVKRENTPKYKLGLIKSDAGYKIIYLSGAENPGWKVGDVKAYLTKTATPSLYKVKYFMGNKTVNEDLYIGFESGLMKIIWTDRQENLYLKLYPTSEDNITTFSGVKSSGTGFAITSNGYIVTNHHVVEGASKISVRGVKGNFSRIYSAKVIVVDKNNDLAIIKIDDQSFTSLGTPPYKVNNNLSDVGNSVYALGYPLRATMGDEVKLTNGIISSKTGFQGDITTYQITVPVQPGNSGGPLFDSKGNIIGIINAKHTGAENASYAIKTSYLMNLIQVMNTTPSLPKTNTISNKSLSEQVKFVKEFVYIIETE